MKRRHLTTTFNNWTRTHKQAWYSARTRWQWRHFFHRISIPAVFPPWTSWEKLREMFAIVTSLS